MKQVKEGWTVEYQSGYHWIEVAEFKTEAQAIQFCEAHNWEVWNHGFRHRLDYSHYTSAE